MLELLGYAGAILTGLSLGVIGGGGSILIVPILVYMFSVSPAIATAYSLFIVGLASGFGAYQYSKKGLIDYKTAIVFATPSFVGVYSARRFLLPSLSEEIANIGSYILTKDTLIMLVFAIVMLFASISMIRKKATDENDDSTNHVTYNYKMIAIEGLGVGLLTGFVGAGGGFLIIPALVLFAKLPMKLAVGTSLSIISAKSLLGFLGDIGASQAIDWGFLSIISALTVLGIIIGSYISDYIPGKKLKPLFGWFVLVMGTYILVKQLI